MLIKCESLKELYEKAGVELLNMKEISPRGLKTKEAISAKIILTNPRNRLYYHKDRNFSLIHALVESTMLFSKSNDLRYFSTFNDNIKQFSDDGKVLYGSYGKRLYKALPHVISALQKDNFTRQACINIYSSDDLVYNNTIGTKDVPCTLNLQFLIRDEKLVLIVNMRSNDIIWGTPYDIYMFTILQEVIANTLGIEVGEYIHNAGSLHVYEKHYKLLELISKKDSGENVQMRIDAKLHDMNFLAAGYKYLVDADTYTETWGSDYLVETMAIFNYKRLTKKSREKQLLESYEKEVQSIQWARKFI